MKISFLRLENTPFGGAEVYLQRVTEVLAEQGIEHEVIHSTAPKFLASWIKALWFNSEAKRQKGSKFYFALARVTSADIYRAGDGVHRAYMQAMGLKFWRNPMHATACFLEKRVFRNAKVIIANSQMVKQEIIDHYQIPADKIKVIVNGIKPPAPIDAEAAKHAVCAELNLPIGKPIILFVGSGFKRKGGDIFLNIISQLKGDYSAIVVGKDKQLKRYQSMADALGIANKVRFVGQRRDVANFYAASDIFLFPPRYEPFSNVVLEAMSYGNVVFTSKRNGASEVLPEDYIIHGDKDPGIAAKIDALLNDPKRLAVAKAEHLATVKAYAIERNVAQTLSVITACLPQI